jgi:hypothetical protein
MGNIIIRLCKLVNSISCSNNSSRKYQLLLRLLWDLDKVGLVIREVQENSSRLIIIIDRNLISLLIRMDHLIM